MCALLLCRREPRLVYEVLSTLGIEACQRVLIVLLVGVEPDQGGILGGDGHALATAQPLPRSVDAVRVLVERQSLLLRVLDGLEASQPDQVASFGERPLTGAIRRLACCPRRDLFRAGVRYRDFLLPRLCHDLAPLSEGLA